MCNVRIERLGLLPVIALRRNIERGVRHPLLGPLCLVLLALLLTFTVIHGAHDQMHGGDALLVCVAFLIGAIVSLAFPRLRMVAVLIPRPARGPPARVRARRVPSPRPFAFASAPLRL
jgi:hypothetical protein